MTEKDYESCGVVAPVAEPQPVAEKRQKPMSAAAAKRVKKFKPPRQHPGCKGYAPPPDGPRDDHFLCLTCGRTHPNSEIGREFGGGFGGGHNNKECRACNEKAASIADGSFRYGHNTFKSLQKNRTRTAAKNYKKGKLPGWMFS